MHRIIALDVGSVRIGIALSDIMQIIAAPYENYKRKNITQDIAHIIDIIKEQNVKKVIAGLPVSMDGSMNEQCIKTKDFIDKFEKAADIAVEYVDERFSSVSAERVLLQADVGRRDRKQYRDKLAAAIFLQSYLDKINNKKKENK